MCVCVCVCVCVRARAQMHLDTRHCSESSIGTRTWRTNYKAKAKAYIQGSQRILPTRFEHVTTGSRVPVFVSQERSQKGTFDACGESLAPRDYSY